VVAVDQRPSSGWTVGLMRGVTARKLEPGT
jgi:hypothetical protein